MLNKIKPSSIQSQNEMALRNLDTRVGGYNSDDAKEV